MKQGRDPRPLDLLPKSQLDNFKEITLGTHVIVLFKLADVHAGKVFEY